MTRQTQDDLFEQSDAMSQSYESGITLEDPEVRLAAEVLGSIHRSGDPTSAESPAFLNRVSEYPIVSSAVRAYESGKFNSRGFKYAAQTIESVARPVVRKFEPLDEFACRQLDRIERRYQPATDIEKQTEVKRKHLADEDDLMQDVSRSRRSSSHWQNVISTASGLTISLSDESLKSLRYCVEWLQWANGHIHGLLGGLRAAADPRSDLQIRDMSFTEKERLSLNITHVRKEIAETLKKLVGIVSNYAGAALPESARGRVRGFVLGLPGRWAARQSTGSREYPPEKVESTHEVERELASVTSLAKESLEV